MGLAMLKGVLVLLFYPILLYAQEWRVVPSGVSSYLKDVQFVNKLVGWAGGGDSTLIKTTDGGNTWFQQYLPIGGDVDALWFIDEQTGWIVGGGISKGSGLYKTIDGGDNWKQYPVLGDFTDIQFVSKDTGWAVGYSIRRVWKTTDGGETWQEKGTGLFGVFTSCSFLNGMEGWVAGAYSYIDNFENEIIYHTTDGGDTWEQQDSPNRTGPLNKIHVLPSGTGFAYGWGQGTRTTNRGETWEAMGPGSQATSLFALDEKHVYVGCGWSTEFHFYLSEDIGKTWRKMDCELENMSGGIFFLDSTFGFAVGVGGKVWQYVNKNVSVSEHIQNISSQVASIVYPNPIQKLFGQNTVTIIMSNTIRLSELRAYLTNEYGERIDLQSRMTDAGSNIYISFPICNLAGGVYYYNIVNYRANRIVTSGKLYVL